MTKIVSALAVVIAVLALDQRPSLANEAPWCAMRNIGKGNVYWDCQYRSFEDCYHHLFEGNGGFCNENPRYHGNPPRQHAPRHRVRQE
jgi:Protein of unknown function (DUF3551)